MEKEAFKTIGKQLELAIHLELSKLNEEAATNTAKHIKEAARHIAKKFAKEAFALQKSLKSKETESADPSAKKRNAKRSLLKSDQKAGSKRNIAAQSPKTVKPKKVKAVKKSAKPATTKKVKAVKSSVKPVTPKKVKAVKKSAKPATTKKVKAVKSSVKPVTLEKVKAVKKPAKSVPSKTPVVAIKKK